MGVVKMLGVLMGISAVVFRAECALTITGLSSVTIDKMGTFAAQTAAVTETVSGDKKFTMTQPAGDKFKIGLDTGVLESKTAGATFDIVMEYPLVITATEEGAATENTGTVSITVTVVDRSPVFAPTTYTKTFTGDQGAGKVLLTVTATDPAVTPGTIDYSLMSMTGTGMWDPTSKLMVESDGKIKVKTGQTLMFGANNMKYEFVCKAALANDATKMATAMVKLEYSENGVAAVYSSVVVMLFALILTYFF